MPIHVVKNDITKMKVDAIVNPTDPIFSGSGGVDMAVHKAAGLELSAECKMLGVCVTGNAKMTRAYNLPCKYVIHTVGPVWGKHDGNEHRYLVSCYKRSLELAQEAGCETIAFPLISAGTFGYPKDKALRVMFDTISEFLIGASKSKSDETPDMTIFIVLFDEEAFVISRELFKNIEDYINTCYVSEEQDSKTHVTVKTWTTKREEPTPTPESYLSENIGESFSEALFCKIREAHINEVKFYQSANLNNKLFSKVRKKDYRPSKPIALALVAALKLSLDESRNLLAKAGYTISHADKTDIIVEYYIKHKNYQDVHDINATLLDFKLNGLGQKDGWSF